MRERLIKFIATGFGVGYAPIAPGTVGSLLGVGYWWLLTRGNVWVYWLVFAAGVAFAVWCAGEAAEALRRPDPPCVVIDEIAAMPLALAGLGVQPWKIVVGFLWFRLFDVWKPTPVRQTQAFSGGVGIVLDDLLAALYACGATHAVVWAVERIGHRSF
jgi:phosphatidylglycerophosphatase A